GDYGTIAKLTRVVMLAPVVITLGFVAAKGRGGHGHNQGHARRRAPMPYFVLGFIALVVVNSVVAVPPAAGHRIAVVTTFLLSMALAAMGLETDVRKLWAKGLRPLLLAATSW